jgi:hypothetical protein
MEYDCCASCMQRLYENKAQICIECKRTSYCNKACQRAHWKFHKLQCKCIQESRLVNLEMVDQKRIRHWFTKWMTEGKDSAILAQLFVGCFGWDTLKSMSTAEPTRRSFVSLKVDFNYNWRTFLLTEPPTIIASDSVDNNELLELMHKSYDEAKEKTARFLTEKEWTLFVACVQCGDKLFRVLNFCIMRDDSTARAPLESLLDNLKGVTLTSKKFHRWTSHSNKNVSKQIKAIKEDDNFTLFWGHALHMHCAEPRDLSHAIMVDWEEGWGLGEIKKLKRFRVVTKEEAVAEYEERCRGQVGFDMESVGLQLDLLLYSLDQDYAPNAPKMAVIMFLGEAFNHIVSANLLQMPRSTELDLAPRESDKEALRAFINLVRLGVSRVSLES